MLGLVGFAVGFGVKGHKNESFKVIDAFHLETWFHIAGPLNFDKGVLYLLIATALTLGIMVWVARHMQKRPGRLQVAVEWGYDLMSRLTRENMDEKMTRKWFPLIFTLFVFILVSNLIGYIPLPVDSQNTFKLFGVNIPSFQIYAAVTNVAVPLMLALGVFCRLQHRRSPCSPWVLRVPEKPDPAGRGRADADRSSTRWRSSPTSCDCSR